MVLLQALHGDNLEKQLGDLPPAAPQERLGLVGVVLGQTVDQSLVTFFHADFFSGAGEENAAAFVVFEHGSDLRNSDQNTLAAVLAFQLQELGHLCFSILCRWEGIYYLLKWVPAEWIRTTDLRPRCSLTGATLERYGRRSTD